MKPNLNPLCSFAFERENIKFNLTTVNKFQQSVSSQSLSSSSSSSLQYLCNSPGSDVPRLLTPDSESELLYDKVIICPEPVLEIHYPPPEALPALPSGLEPDSR